MKNIICSLCVLSIVFYACGRQYESLEDCVVLSNIGYGSGSGGGAGKGMSNCKYEQAVEACDEEYIVQEDVMEIYNSAFNSSKNAEKFTSVEKKIIKDGDIIIQTNDIEIAKQRIDSLVKNLNAYYEREDLRKGPARIIYDLIIRVPADNFEKLFSSIEQGKDEVKNKSIRVRDVTEEYVDLTARLTSKRDYLKQYTVLLSKATKISEILEIQEKIRNLREEIESAEGRLRYLSDQVTFSTLNVSLEKEVEYVYKPAQKDHFTERVKSGLNTGWDIIVGIIVFLINIWSVLLLFTLVFFSIRWRIKKRKARKSKN
jgi:Rad3-related DNA helicase